MTATTTKLTVAELHRRIMESENAIAQLSSEMESIRGKIEGDRLEYEARQSQAEALQKQLEALRQQHATEEAEAALRKDIRKAKALGSEINQLSAKLQAKLGELHELRVAGVKIERGRQEELPCVLHSRGSDRITLTTTRIASANRHNHLPQCAEALAEAGVIEATE